MNNIARPFRITWLFGLTLLAASGAGAGWFLHAPTTAAGLKDAPNAAKAADESSTDAVVIGLVDVEEGIMPLFPVQSGRVVAVSVKEGQDVSAGSVLLRQDDRLAKLTI